MSHRAKHHHVPLATLALLVCIPGCATTDPVDQDQITITTIFGVQFYNRHFIFNVLEATMPDEQVDTFLQIEGDDAIISFFSSTPPYVPVVIGDVVEYGGHDFQVTPTPNTFLIDGATHTLPPHTLNAFVDGQFVGRHAP